MLRSLALSAGLAVAASPLAAHPHIFIDSGLEFVLDDAGQLTAIEVTWVYDELYSLILIEDQRLDPDGDGALTEDELALLARQDQDWGEEYEGDLYGTADGAKVALGPPEAFALSYQDGRITSSHRRPLAEPLDPAKAADLVFKNYDPWFYAAFDVSLPVSVRGGSASCRVEVTEADYAAANARTEALIKAAPQDTLEMDFPMVGEDYADTVRVRCDAS